ncbi:translation initiation factor IF-2 isoform X2 [Plodia interpunctella]|uniref:translation initiation factor IF-2 isoform X2 n=1 Tax=Plodia interpunctella TaxID=58824 RepID=UPI002367AE7A|nr:translation initiation factor IF-2 isoform X2 [Plodia interpunctella]
MGILSFGHCTAANYENPCSVFVIKVPSSISQLIGSYNYEDSSILDSIPEHDWRLLAALARKREDDIEREKLADQFRKLWQREKQERNMVAAETSEQYKRYLHKKRQEENTLIEYQRCQRTLDQQVRRGRLLDCIRQKEMKSAAQLQALDEKKVSELVDRVIEEEARALLAADRRIRLENAEKWRKKAELEDAQRREDDAKTRRVAMLKDMSKRAAISNALSTWETALLRQEITALDAQRRAQHAAHAARTMQRAAKLARARAERQQRARRLAAVTAELRNAVRHGNL